jgi:anthranilate phosphoribosyltransferase
LSGGSLDEDTTAGAMVEIMDGAATPAQIAGFVTALRAKGETTDEVVGLVRTMREYAQRVDAGPEVLDTCGTGGDRAGTFNVSTAAAIVCAGAGVKVAKHGNRAASSRAGSADVLEALGVKIDLDPQAVEHCIAQAGIGFCFAPIFHPAMRHTAVTRRELGIATIFNFLGPLTNPAGAKHQALGVSDPMMLDRMVETLARLGSVHVVGFHGHEGLDELSTSGPSRVVELRDSQTHTWTLDPADLDLPPATRSDIAGGDADENARLLRSVLEGESGPRRDIVVLNAAAGLLAAGRHHEIGRCFEMASEAIDSGAAAETLARWVQVSQSPV